MPEANVLYSVTAAVVLGLVTWVAVVLKTAKEPWARDLPKRAPAADDVPLETPAENEMTSEGGPSPDAPTRIPAPATAPAKSEDAKAEDAKAEAKDAKAEAEDAKAEAETKAAEAKT